MAYGDFGRSTELEAVNICLSIIGEQPVDSVPESGISKATLARDILYELSREVQLEGLACNTDTEYELTPNVDNEITLPATTISIDPSHLYNNRYVERTGKLYDTKNQTFTITENIKVDIIWFLEWLDLPEHVRRYTLIRAARVFQKRFLADENLHRFTEEDEIAARHQFSRKELRITNFSILDNANVNPKARDILYEVSREVQLEGLACNTDTEYELTPNTEIATLTGVSISNANPSVLTKVTNPETIDDNLAVGDGVIVNSGTNSIPGTYVVVSIIENVSVTLDDQAADGACTDGNITYYDVGEITLPATAISIDPSYLYDNRYVERGGKLYDTKNQTFTITKNIKVDIIWFLEWLDLPEHVKQYILVKATRIFQKRFFADENLHQFTKEDKNQHRSTKVDENLYRFTEEDEIAARRQFSRKELKIADFSILDNANVNPRFYRRG